MYFSAMSKGEQVNLQHTLTFVSFFYFTYSASKACLFPFLSLYFRQLGLSATQTGIIYGLKAFVALWAAPVWSTCATQYGRQRIVLMVAIFMTIASNLGLTLLPPTDESLYFAFCIQRNSTPSLNGSRIYNNIGNANFMQTSPSSTSSNSLSSGIQFSTPILTVTSSNIQSTQQQLTTESNLVSDIKTTSQQFVPSQTRHPKTSHGLPATHPPSFHSSKPNGHKSHRPHKPSAKPIQESNHKDSSLSSDTPSNNDINYDLDLDTETNIVTPATHIGPLKSPVDENTRTSTDISENRRPFASKTTNMEISNPYINTGISSHDDDSDGATRASLGTENSEEAQYVLNWKHQMEHNSVSEKHKIRPSTNPKVHTSTTKFEKKHRPFYYKKGKINNHIAKRSEQTDPENDPENISSTDNFPRSLGIAQDSLSKTISSFLEFQQLLFAFVLLIVVIGESFSCPVDKICDSSLYETLDAIDELDKYKRHNVPSVIGYGLFALIVAVIVDNTNCEIFLQASHFMIHFYSFACLLGLTFLLAFFYPIPAPKKGTHKLRFCKGLRLLLGDPNNALVTLTMVVAGALASNIHNFLFWHVQDLGGSEVVMGVAVLISITSHLPMLFITGWLSRKLSQTGILVLALLCLAVRLLYFTFLWTPWAVVPVEILCAFSQQALWQTVSTYGEQISPPAMERSVKSILNSLYHGLGFAIGSALGGLIYDLAGLQVLYGSSAALGFVWCVVIVVAARFSPKKRKLHYSSLLRREDGDAEYVSDEDSDEVYGNDWLVKALKDDF